MERARETEDWRAAVDRLRAESTSLLRELFPRATASERSSEGDGAPDAAPPPASSGSTA